MLGSLLAAALAALAPAGETTRLELDVAAQLDGRTMSALPTATVPSRALPPPGSGRWIGGGVCVGVDVYGRRVVDDDAPPPLQPFLQRVARFRVSAGGSGASIRYPIYFLNPSAPSSFLLLYPASDAAGRFDAQADGYIGRWLFVAAHLAVDYERWQPAPVTQAIGGFGNVTPISAGAFGRSDSSELTLTGAAAAGVRFGDVLLSAGWGLTAFRVGDDALAVRFWAGAFVSGRAIVRRRVEIGARIELLDGGAAAEGAVTVWLRRRVGISLGLEGGHGAFADSAVAYDRAGGHVGLSWWLSPRLGATLAYAPAWQQALPLAGIGIALRDFSYVAHVVTLTVSARPWMRR